MKKIAHYFFGMAACTAWMFGSDASAASLVTYAFTNSNDNASFVSENISLATSLSIGVLGTEFGTVGDSATGNGWSSGTTTNTGDASAAPPTRFIRVGNLTGSEGAAVTANDYFQFTVTPDAGFTANLTDLTFDIASTGGGTNASNEAYWFLRTDVDSFSANVGSVASITATTNTTTPYNRFAIDLSDGAFQDLSSGITLRLYTFSINTNINGLNRIDNIILSGDIVPIPEPSSYALLLMGGITLLILRRQHSLKSHTAAG